jgi:nitric oxide reductase subunit C
MRVVPIARIIALLIALLIAGCSRSVESVQAPVSAGEQVARGRTVFEQKLLKQTPGCITCHSLEPGVVVVGPSLNGVATRAARVLASGEYKGLAKTPAEFLQESILTPKAYLSSGFSHSVMPEWEGVLERQQLLDLVAFLSTME